MAEVYKVGIISKNIAPYIAMQSKSSMQKTQAVNNDYTDSAWDTRVQKMILIAGVATPVVSFKQDNLKSAEAVPIAMRPLLNKISFQQNTGMSFKRLSIWGDVSLDLMQGSRLNPYAREKMTNEISRVLNNESYPTSMKNPRVFSVSYEGWGHAAGGQADIANQLPAALKNVGIDSCAIAPMFNINVIDKNGNVTRYGVREDDGVLKYFAPGFKEGVEVEKVYSGKMGHDDLVIYRGLIGPAKQEVLFLSDNKHFNFGDVRGYKNIYQNFWHSNERLRMAQFNNMFYHTVLKLQRGEVKLADGEAVKPPDKVVLHEAWQSGGFLCKARLLSYAEESDGIITAHEGDALRKLADNSIVTVHNIGNDYQGQEGYPDLMKDYWNTLYGKYAHEIVENSCIADNGRDIGMFGTPSQRVGFFAQVLNPAHAAMTLATRIGPVSEGYLNEILKHGLAAKLSDLIKLRGVKGGLVSLPNGVDKRSYAASAENVAKLNAYFGDSLNKKIVPYLEKFDSKEPININEFMQQKRHNKEIYVELLKDSVTNPNQKIFLTPPNFYQGAHGIDITGITADTPIFSMASRLDDQKGFDTIVDAYSKLMEGYCKSDPNRPVLLLSGGGNDHLSWYIKTAKDRLGADGDRLLFTEQRVSNEGLMLTNMTTRNIMPSDFEPYGISELKGLYAGSHVICTEVGGMKSIPAVSRKIFSYAQNPEKANAVTVPDYDYMCMQGNQRGKDLARTLNARALKEAMSTDIRLDEKVSAQMDINALHTDVSWNKGAIQNYCDQMAITLDKDVLNNLKQRMAV